MQRNRTGSPSEEPKLRVLLVDDCAISRAECRAPLRSEGVDVGADLAANDAGNAAADDVLPRAVIIDATSSERYRLQLAGRLRTREPAPIVVPTSSADRSMFDSALDACVLVAKADVCNGAIFTAIRREGHAPTTDRVREEGPQRG